MAHPALPDFCQVMLADLSSAVIAQNDAHSLLDPQQTRKASTIRSPVRRHQYVQCVALLRMLLQERTGLPADKITFCKGEFDKPLLSGPAAATGITFNISHSGPLAVIAISSESVVGVDIEQIKPARNTMEIADQFFVPAELHAIKTLNPDRQINAFYSCWCRKESFIKATGMGMRLPLNRFAVNVEPEAAARLLWVNYQELHLTQWQMYTLLTPAGYFGALTLGNPAL